MIVCHWLKWWGGWDKAKKKMVIIQWKWMPTSRKCTKTNNNRRFDGISWYQARPIRGISANVVHGTPCVLYYGVHLEPHQSWGRSVIERSRWDLLIYWLFGGNKYMFQWWYSLSLSHAHYNKIIYTFLNLMHMWGESIYGDRSLYWMRGWFPCNFLIKC